MMLKAMAVVGSVLLLSSALGCEEPAVTDDGPNGAVMGMAGSGGFAGANAGAGGAVAGTGGAGGAVAGMGGASGAAGSGGMGGEGGVVAGTGGAGSTVAGMGGEGGTAGGGAGGAVAGMGGVGGVAGGGTGGMGGAAGDDAPPGPCPTGWSCEDTSWTGAVDEAGKPITGTSCGKGDIIMCNPADPMGTCPELSKPICATVFEINSCTQLCTP